MKPSCRCSYLEVGHIGSVPVHVPVITLGEGNPHLAIMCGIHGDEIAGSVIAHHFMRELLRRGKLQGSVSIITAANPFAQITRTRVTISDFADLNRMGLGKKDGTFTLRLAHVICSFIQQCDFFVDFHDFIMSTPNMALYFPNGEETVDQQIVRGIAAFKPSVIWSVKLSTQQESKYGGSLAVSLIEQGIPGFAIETSRIVELSSNALTEAVDGLLEVTKFLHIIDGPYRQSTAPAFTRQEMHSHQAGIWMPSAILLQQVKVGDPIGTVTPLGSMEDYTVRALLDGYLIQLASVNLIDTGTSLFTIGVADTVFEKKLKSFVVKDQLVQYQHQ